MIEIKEDYVTFETAKLLKERGFNIITKQAKKSYGDSRDNDIIYFTFYEQSDTGEVSFKKAGTNSSLIHGLIAYYGGTLSNSNLYKWYLAPEHWQVLKWLRLVHHIYISNDDLSFTISGNSFATVRSSLAFRTYEDATEAAIQYILKHLL